MKLNLFFRMVGLDIIYFGKYQRIKFIYVNFVFFRVRFDQFESKGKENYRFFFFLVDFDFINFMIM